MKRYYLYLWALILLTFSSLTLQSCRTEEQQTVSCFPSSPISVVLDLNYPAYYDLQNINGWIYVDEQQCGTKGLIVVRTTNGFKIYDRNAPHLCPDGDNTKLEVNANIKVVCPKDNAEWILLTGEPIAVSQVPPRTYPYTYNPTSKILSIYY